MKILEADRPQQVSIKTYINIHKLTYIHTYISYIHVTASIWYLRMRKQKFKNLPPQGYGFNQIKSDRYELPLSPCCKLFFSKLKLLLTTNLFRSDCVCVKYNTCLTVETNCSNKAKCIYPITSISKLLSRLSYHCQKNLTKLSQDH